MNISAINNFNLFQSQKISKRDNLYTPQYGLKLSKPLSQDVVSFKGGIPLSKFMEAGLEKEEPQLRAIATQFLDTTEAIANKLKERGVSFDRLYCEKGCIKKPDSCVSKMGRSGLLNVPDRVRTTIYVKNPYDLSVLDEIINEYRNRGYEIAQTEISVDKAISMGFAPKSTEIRKDKVKIPDIDIRLNDTTDEPIIGKTREIIHYISGANSNGYEDIQMRFVNPNAPKKFKEIQHELIILMGPNYAHAKTEESQWIYNALREFKTLNIAQDTNLQNPARKQASVIADSIKKIFANEISSKLFENAKNKDFYEIVNENPINITDLQIRLLNERFKNLHSKITAYYKGLQEKTDNPLMKRDLEKMHKDDRAKVLRIQKDLRLAIEHFNNPQAKKTK